MDVGLDTGDMIHKESLLIGENMTFEELYLALRPMGAEVLGKTLEEIEVGKAPRTAQVDAESSYAPLLNKKNTMIDWTKSAEAVHNHIRGLKPIPVALTLYNGERIKVFASLVMDQTTNEAPGTILKVSKFGLDVATGQGVVRLTEIQFPNAKRLQVSQIILGRTIDTGTVLGV